MAPKKQAVKAKKTNLWVLSGVIAGLIAIAFLLTYRLGSIMPGITAGESSFYGLKLGWHGLYHNPLNLPLDVLYSILFKFLSPVGMTLLRVPSVITGGLTIVAFFALLILWYGQKTAIFGTALFATSAWTLHVSRLADFNVEYLAAIVFFFLTTAILQKKLAPKYIYWLINLAWGLLLYVPGMVFLIAYNLYRQRGEIGYGMKLQDDFKSKLAFVFSGLIWIPLIARYLIKNPKNILSWLGLPQKFASPQHIVKEFGAVFYHIFIRGPLLPNLWLGRSPILDIFGVVTALTGIYFYITHIKATRTHLLFVSFLIGVVLIALGGPVSLSIVLPIVYIFIAAGLAYLLTQWLSVFPKNPIARSLGYVLISLAVAMSMIYNLRSYFIAWPHNSASVSVFDVTDKD